MDIEKEIKEVSRLLEREPENTELLMQRALLYQKLSLHDRALNDYLKVSEAEPDNQEARAYIELLQEIINYRYMLFYDV